MEQYSQYLMLVKSKNNIHMNPYSSHSWEEQAFAEDARGPLGGFVWPPRSYPCSFCRREFRSAQALGGHMNVHRREKATLKQTHISTSATTNATQNHSKVSRCKGASRVSSIPVLGQESLDSNSDPKSCVYDEDFVVADHGNVDVETTLVLGFDVNSWSNTISDSKRRKTTGVIPPPIMAGSMDGLDLELRLTS